MEFDYGNKWNDILFNKSNKKKTRNNYKFTEMFNEPVDLWHLLIVYFSFPTFLPFDLALPSSALTYLKLL